MSFDWLIGGPPPPAGSAVGIYNPTFESGWIQFCGPGNTLDGDVNLQYGALLPNPTGNPGPCLFLGSGGGSGTAITFCIIQDQAFDDVTPGNNLIYTAGETQPAGTADGGNLTGYGGGSYAGDGGINTIQGGTSLHGPGGIAVLQGGNNTDETQVPGDAFVIAGEEAGFGGNIHLVATEPTGSSTYGVVRVRFNSDIAIDFIAVGAPSGGDMPVGMYVYKGGGYGLAGQPLVSGGPSATIKWFTGGFTGSIPSGFTSIAVASGLITGYT